MFRHLTYRRKICGTFRSNSVLTCMNNHLYVRNLLSQNKFAEVVPHATFPITALPNQHVRCGDHGDRQRAEGRKGEALRGVSWWRQGSRVLQLQQGPGQV